MKFEEIFPSLKKGMKGRRNGWNSKNTFVSVYAKEDSGMDIDFLYIDTSDSTTSNKDYKKGKGPYTPSMCDLFSDDWEFVYEFRTDTKKIK